MAIAPVTGRFAPPVQDAPMRPDGTQHSQAWTEYHQRIADYLHNLPIIVRNGSTDDTEAAPGQIGEYFEVNALDIPIVSNAATSIIEMDVGAGDWDLRGYAFFKPDPGTDPASFSTSLSQNDNAEGNYPSLIQSPSFVVGGHAGQWVGPDRYKFATNTSVWLVCKSVFSGGSMLVTGHIFARRVR